MVNGRVVDRRGPVQGAVVKQLELSYRSTAEVTDNFTRGHLSPGFRQR